MLKKRPFWESFIIIVILLSIIEIFLEEIGVIAGWSVSLRSRMLIIGFIFDVIFTLEFSIRSSLAKKNKGWKYYWKNEKGWVDFLSSIPLVLFNSGPIMLGMFFPGKVIALPFLGLLNILKITKILRVSRMLRMLRILKIFHKISEEESELKLNQVSSMTSIAVLTITIILIFAPLFSTIYYSQDVNIDRQRQKYISIMKEWNKSLSQGDEAHIEKLQFILERDSNVMYMYYMGGTVVNHLGDSEVSPANVIPTRFLYTDFKVLRYLDFKLLYSVKDTLIDNSKVNLLIETIVVGLIIAFLIFYKPSSSG